SRRSSLMSAPTSSRTTSPNRRRRSSASTASSRSSASSETSKSASRVTRKTPWATTSIPGNSAGRSAAMTSSSATNVRPSPPAVRPRIAQARVDLVVKAGDADHEELVEVRREDRAELQALEQRLVVLLAQLEDALVERQPRQLSIVVELRIVEVRRRLGLGGRR